MCKLYKGQSPTIILEDTQRWNNIESTFIWRNVVTDKFSYVSKFNFAFMGKDVHASNICINANENLYLVLTRIKSCCWCCCVFGYNVALNNFSVISRRCLVATGRSVLIFIMLPHWSIMAQTLDMIQHPATLSWHLVDQSYLRLVSLSAKRVAASAIFNDFGISRPGIGPVTSRSPERTLYWDQK